MMMETTRVLQLYYLATPLFFLGDVVLHAPIRVSSLPDPRLRYAYYLLCLVCGVVCLLRPALARHVSCGESAVNLLLLVLSLIVPIRALPADFVAGTAGPLLTPAHAMNALLSVGIVVVAFRRNGTGIRPARMHDGGMWVHARRRL